MANEAPETVRVDVPQIDGGPLHSSIVVTGSRLNFVDMLGAVLFAGVLVAVILTGGAGIVLYVLTPFVLINLWACLMQFFRRPRAAIQDGVFSLRLLPNWRTSATNVSNLELRNGKLTVTFHDAETVDPTEIRPSLRRQFAKRGYHCESRQGVFSLDQVNTLRTALAMPLQQQDRFADFQAALNRLTPRVIITPALVAANVLVFLAMALTGADVSDPNTSVMLAWGANHGPHTCNGQWWRLLTSMFLHFGAIHLLVNMWTLNDIGRFVERLTGNVGFAIGYVISGFFGSVASVLWNGSAVSAGSSGAIFGVFGMLLGFVALHRHSIPKEVINDHRGNAILFLVFNVVIGFSIPWIDQAAHIGGLLAGFLCGLVLGCDLASAAVKRRFRNTGLAVTGAVAATLAVINLPAQQPDLIWIGTRIDEVDQAAVDVYQKALTSLQNGQQTAAEAAAQIKASIVPNYGGLAASLEEVRPRSTEQNNLKSALVEYLKLRREGWELMSKAIENDDFVLEGRAVENFEAALRALADVMPHIHEELSHPSTDLRTELAVLSACESRASEKYDELMRRHSMNEFDDQQLAISIASEVLPTWQSGRERFTTAAHVLPSQDQALIARIMNYLELQNEGWLLQVEALRDRDDAKASQSREKLEEAAKAAAAIWQHSATARD